MASERHERCAALLRDGTDYAEAMILAGWPELFALGFGVRIFAFLRAAGCDVPDCPDDDAAPPEAAVVPDPMPEPEPSGPVPDFPLPVDPEAPASAEADGPLSDAASAPAPDAVSGGEFHDSPVVPPVTRQRRAHK